MSSSSDLLVLDDEQHALSNEPVGRTVSSLTLADFETISYKSDPFAALTLDSINDKEELMLLLGGPVTQPVATVPAAAMEAAAPHSASPPIDCVRVASAEPASVNSGSSTGSDQYA